MLPALNSHHQAGRTVVQQQCCTHWLGSRDEVLLPNTRPYAFRKHLLFRESTNGGLPLTHLFYPTTATTSTTTCPPPRPQTQPAQQSPPGARIGKHHQVARRSRHHRPSPSDHQHRQRATRQQRPPRRPQRQPQPQQGAPRQYPCRSEEETDPYRGACCSRLAPPGWPRLGCGSARA